MARTPDQLGGSEMQARDRVPASVLWIVASESGHLVAHCLCACRQGAVVSGVAV